MILEPVANHGSMFRSRRADKLKMIVWDGTGLVLTMKRLDGKRFVWPKAQSGPMMLNQVQFDALFSGVDWRGIAVNAPRKPAIA